MEIPDKDLSLYFYHYMSNLIGTEEVVKKRRQILKASDFVHCNPDATPITSGSKAEGLDLKGSDTDVMFCYKHFRVCENVDNINTELQSGQYTQVIMNTENTKPGFTFLKVYDISLGHEENCEILSACCEKIANQIYISSTRFTEYILSENPGMTIHGPCVTNKQCDHARCFHCDKWISCCYPWIYRSRNSWPNNEVMDRIVDFGVLFVPIGCKGSENEHLEWRISFSVAEKELIHSFNHVQLLCYGLLKILLKDIIQKSHGDMICSYFLKTLMFWVIEETEQSRWKPENFLLCFMKCFKRLLYCVKYQTCLHYFIPENNFFEGRFLKCQYEDLLSTLISLDSLGWRSILYTDTLQMYSNLSVFLSVFSPIAPKVTFFNFLLNSPCISNSEIQSFFKAIFGCLYLTKKQLYLYQLSKISLKLSQIDIVNSITTVRHKQMYNYYKRCMFHLLLGTNRDAVCGWLYMASFFYTRKQYKECIYLVDYCLSKLTSDNILLYQNPSILSQSYTQFMYERCGLIATCKHFTIFPSIIFIPSSNIIPTELKQLQNEKNDVWIPCPVFGLLLKFLCFHHLGDDRRKSITFMDLTIAVENDYFMVQNELQQKQARDSFNIAKMMLEL